MLIRFVVSNYLSFGTEAEFNMLTGPPRRMKDHIYHFGDMELLKTAAIYGANGAGKSNLVKAMLLLQEIVINDQSVNAYRITPFRLDSNLKDQPTHLEIEFISEGISYSYGLDISENTIIEEWLYKTSVKKDELIFIRTTKDGKTKIEVNKSFLQSPEDEIRIRLYEEELLPDNKPLLHLLATAKKVFPDIKKAYQWFEEGMLIIDPGSRSMNLSAIYVFSEKFRHFLNDLFKTLNTGIEQIDMETIPIDRYFGEDDREETEQIKNRLRKDNEAYELIQESHTHHLAVAVWENDQIVVKRLVAKHRNTKGELVEFEMDEESDGTLRILDFAPAIYNILFSPRTVIIDEIDQSIHPFLLKNLVAKFVQDQNAKGQFIFTTHESNLLDQGIFRQDEIWFVEKKKSGETTLYPLSDFDVRFDLNIQKGYLNGRFGAIPFLGNLKDLNWDIYAEEEQSV